MVDLQERVRDLSRVDCDDTDASDHIISAESGTQGTPEYAGQSYQGVQDGGTLRANVRAWDGSATEIEKPSPEQAYGG